MAVLFITSHSYLPRATTRTLLLVVGHGLGNSLAFCVCGLIITWPWGLLQFDYVEARFPLSYQNNMEI